MTATVANETEPQYENPGTWVRDAWGVAGVERLRARSIPAGISEAEWDMLRKHVLMDQPYAKIAVGYSEPPSRIRQFIEAATRSLIPSQSMTTEAAGAGGDVRTVSALIGAQSFYTAIGSPFGNDPGQVGPTLQALANHGGVLEAIRDALRSDPLEMPSGNTTAIAPATSRELLKGEDE